MSEAVTQGTQASAGSVNTALNAVEIIGQNALSTLYNFQTLIALQYANRESYINSKRILANRVLGPGIPISISAGDFIYIDQGLTTGSLRADSGGCMTKETLTTFSKFVDSSFTTSIGDLTNLDTTNELYQVVSDTIPTGTFLATLPEEISCNLIIFDILPSPGTPTVSVFVSADNVTFVPFPIMSVNGYRITTSGPPTDTKYVKIVITPSTPDLMNGSTYSFGLTDLTVRGSSLALRSQFSSTNIVFNPIGANLFFGTDDIAGITYYISMSSTLPNSSFLQYSPNIIIPIPGVTVTSSKGITAATVGGVANTLFSPVPTNIYVSSLRVTETIEGVEVHKTVIPNLSLADPDISDINNEYAILDGTKVVFVSSGDLSERLFNVYFSAGPATMNLTLKAVLDSTNTGTSPVFRQAYFEAA